MTRQARGAEPKVGTVAHRYLKHRDEARHLPWPDRLRRVLAWVARYSRGRRANMRGRRLTGFDKDLRRAISDGYCQILPREAGHFGRRGTVKMLVLTDKGRAAIAPPEPAPPRHPYAKRTAGLAEFNAANGLHARKAGSPNQDADE